MIFLVDKYIGLLPIDTRNFPADKVFSFDIFFSAHSERCCTSHRQGFCVSSNNHNFLHCHILHQQSGFPGIPLTISSNFPGGLFKQPVSPGTLMDTKADNELLFCSHLDVIYRALIAHFAYDLPSSS